MSRSVLLLVLFSVISAGSAWAATAEPLSYVITIEKIELSKDGGATYATLASGNRSFTIRSTNASGDIISDYTSGARVEDGEYNALRLTMSNSIGISGRVLQNAGLNAGTTFCTGGTTGVACTPSLVTVTVSNALVVTYGLTVPANTTIVDASADIVYIDRSFMASVGSGRQASHRIAFSTSSALVIQADDTIHPAVPQISLAKN